MSLQVQSCLYPEEHDGCVTMQNHMVWGEKNQLFVEYSIYLASNAQIIAGYLYLHLHLCLHLSIDVEDLIDKASFGLQFGWQLAVSLGPIRFRGK